MVVPSIRLVPALVLALLPSVPAQGAEEPTFARDVRPMLEGHCLGCHDSLRHRGGVDLSKFQDDESVQRQPELWLKVVDVLNDQSMPPRGKPAPAEGVRDKAVEVVEALLEAIEGVEDPGRGVIQRLTREQYNNTIRDLLGVDSRPADAFPSDGGGGSGFDNNASTLFIPPILMEKYLAAAATVLDQADAARYASVRPDDGAGISNEDAARRSIEAFASRAFRRPATAAEVDRLLELFRLADARGDSFEQALKLPMRAVLVSPSFLFLIEKDQDVEGPYRIGHYELASRLSYYLWSSMPDEPLLALAADGTLERPEVLEGQVRRMLADPRSRAFARDFAGQWTRVASLANVAEPERRNFPTYTTELRDAMMEEPVATFHALLRNDAPVLDLIAADHVYVNEILARHYGIEGVVGPEFRRVQVSDGKRGGVLGMAGILTLTSYPRRTSPTLRGKWVLEELLGTPPPPPPAMVKLIRDDDRRGGGGGMTFRQRLEAHRSKAECAACHAKLDPPGFGLESFDPIGRWRTDIAGKPVDDTGEMSTGETFSGPAELKRILLASKKDLFLKNLTERMLSYALRRGIEYYDTPTVKQITAALEARDYKSTVLVAEIVKSFPFQYRRNRPIVRAKP